MDEPELERLAERGLDGLFPAKPPVERPVERLRAVVEYCRDRCETTGDARYCSLGETIGYIVEFFEERGAMEVSTIGNLDHAFKRHLGGVLHAETAESGVLLGRSFREEILASLRDDRLA